MNLSYEKKASIFFCRNCPLDESDFSILRLLYENRLGFCGSSLEFSFFLRISRFVFNLSFEDSIYNIPTLHYTGNSMNVLHPISSFLLAYFNYYSVMYV